MRWVQSQHYPIATKLNDDFAIHLKCFNRGSPSRCQANDLLVIITPGEVLIPSLARRMKQGRSDTIRGVLSCQTTGFEAITARAAEAQVIQTCEATGRFRNDVIYFECNAHQRFGAPAVGAKSTSSRKHLLA